jgi:hypothetical protein
MSRLLPGYMIPFRIHTIDSIPLTSHGKTDYKALKLMACSADEFHQGLPLITATEHRLASLWSELLGQDVRYRDADFFRLGGHSLLMMKMAAHLRNWIDDDLANGPITGLDIRSFYGNPTIEHLGKLINQSNIYNPSEFVSGFRPIPLWNPKNRKGSLFVTLGSHAQMEGFSKYRTMAESLEWKLDVFGLPDPQAVAQIIPDTPIEKLAEIYAKAVMDYHHGGPVILLGECLGGTDAFSTAISLLGKLADPIHIILVDTVCPADIKPERNHTGNSLTATSPATPTLREVDRAETADPALKLMLDDIANARQQLRMAHKFRNWEGDLYVMTNQFLFEEKPTCGWDKLVEGCIFTKRLLGDHDNYLFEHLKVNMDRFDEVLSGILA